MANQSLNLLRRSASTDEPAKAGGETIEVAKLIDVSKCIGCKACQSACLEWNNLREEVGVNTGVYDNPHDLTPNSWTLMRFAEWDNPDTGDLSG
jgi:formate dehydrogenase iron-sulfur subunit